jgi:hypothetical protein
MEQILSLMAFLEAFTFLSMGLCVANSIEAKESVRTANIMIVIMILGIVSFLIGFFGLLIGGIFFWK